MRGSYVFRVFAFCRVLTCGGFWRVQGSDVFMVLTCSGFRCVAGFGGF